MLNPQHATQLAIVIPAYKSTFLRETLESIANQTDKRFHLYIGDDCSPYDIESIVNEFRDRIPLTYKRFEKNLGGTDLVAQWERCISMTQDEPYIWLFSDDDTMDSECVAAFYNAKDCNPTADLFHFNIKMIDDLDNGIIKPLPTYPTTMSAGEYLEAKLRGKIVSYVVEFIFSRELYNKVGGFENFDLAWGSDFMTWLKMAAQSKSGIKTISSDDNCFVNWRRSSENISPDKSHPILIRKIKSLIKNAAFIRRQFKQNSSAYLPLKESFRWVRFPLGEINRNKADLSYQDIFALAYQFNKEVGYPFYSTLSTIRICLYR